MSNSFLNESLLNLQTSPLEPIKHPLFEEYGVLVDMKRDDLIHPVISGNKWRKLKYLLEDAKDKGCQQIISMGGNYSNHLHALAYAGKQLGFKTLGFVRAHPEQELTATLQDCLDWGMELEFCDRLKYAQLRQHTRHDYFCTQYPNSYWLSEGGYSDLAIQGVADIALEIEQGYDYIFVGCGSGATLIGLAQAFSNSEVIGVAAFKGAEYLSEELQNTFPELNNWRLDCEQHLGGFAKSSIELEQALEQFEKLNGFELDTVYNGKVLLTLLEYIESGKIKNGARVLFINTGGVQGNR